MTDNTTKLWNKLRSARQHRKEQQEQHWQDEVLNLKAQIARLELKNAELAAVTSQQSQTITELREIIGKLKCK
jgi:carbonic anhydrase